MRKDRCAHDRAYSRPALLVVAPARSVRMLERFVRRREGQSPIVTWAPIAKDLDGGEDTGDRFLPCRAARAKHAFVFLGY
jgi:hypothetical protein